VRDVADLGEPPRVVATATVGDVPVRSGRRIPFRVEVPDGCLDRPLNLDVHVDMDGSGVFSAGDLITTATLPVLTGGAPSHVDVPVVPVAGRPEPHAASDRHG
jgi:putative lipoprotein